jgi:terminal uridylyltransferase
MILFIKHWAKVRGINSGYRGTLSSYGYVLMALHYLVNVVQPFVCPNLQQLAPTPPNNLSPAEIESTVTCRGYDVQFWRNEEEIVRLASHNQLNRNTESIGHLLRGFFEYYAQNGMMSNGIGKGFDWGRNVISLRTYGGILTKQEKGWTGAKTIYEVSKPAGDTATPASPLQPTVQPQVAQRATKDGEVKEIRLRYLFAIEDPFETDHNVARTVTHNGIVSIRNEFRRAWSILRAAGSGNTYENLIQDAESQEELSATFSQLLQDIHGLTPA